MILKLAFGSQEKFEFALTIFNTQNRYASMKPRLTTCLIIDQFTMMLMT